MPDLFGKSLTRSELDARTGTLAAIGGITEFTYAAGRARGVRAVRLDTGRLCVDFAIDRALDITRATIDGIPLAWRSANEICAPSYYDPDADEWLRSFFGGWLTTCGLANFGPAGSDQWGAFGLHGRIDNTPADEYAARTAWEGDRCFLELTASMHESKALTSELVLHRRWRTELGSATLFLEDRVVNTGGQRTPHMLLYHCNAGFPLLDATTRVYASRSATQARDAVAQAGIERWDLGGEPVADFAEQVFIHRPIACDDGRAHAAIVNPAACAGTGIGFEIAYDPVALPALFSWRQLAAGTYVMAIEPANTPAIQGRTYAAAHALLPFLEPGEERRYELAFTALRGDDLTASIATIAKANATTAAAR